MKKSMAGIFIFFSVFYYRASAQHFRVTDIQFATSINNRKPVESDTVFSTNVGTVYCYTHGKGGQDLQKLSMSGTIRIRRQPVLRWM